MADGARTTRDYGAAVARFRLPSLVDLAVAGVVVAALLVFPPFAAHQPWHNSFLTYLVAIVLQSTPYLLLGAALGAAVETFVPVHWLPAAARRLGPWGVPAVVLLAPLFPVCECGVLGVGRSLLRRGLPLPHVVVYLIAAPILNPIVIATTAIAFADPHHALLRAVGGALIALVVGGLVSRVSSAWCLRPVLVGFTPLAATGAPFAAAATCPAPSGPAWTRWAAVRWCRTSLEHFLELAGWFLVGVAIAAALKTFVGTRVLETLGAGVVSGPATMMATAVVLSLCAEADAFVAASFTGFSVPALMAFLVIGPMLDLKLLFMYRSLFHTRFVIALAVVLVTLVSLYVAVLTVIA